jgi:hypothetical protein
MHPWSPRAIIKNTLHLNFDTNVIHLTKKTNFSPIEYYLTCKQTGKNTRRHASQCSLLARIQQAVETDSWHVLEEVRVCAAHTIPTSAKQHSRMARPFSMTWRPNTVTSTLATFRAPPAARRLPGHSDRNLKRRLASVSTMSHGRRQSHSAPSLCSSLCFYQFVGDCKLEINASRALCYWPSVVSGQHISLPFFRRKTRPTKYLTLPVRAFSRPDGDISFVRHTIPLQLV